MVYSNHPFSLQMAILLNLFDLLPSELNINIQMPKLSCHGTILYVSSSPSKFRMNLDKDICTGCGLCEEICPSGAITSRDVSDIRNINNNGGMTVRESVL